MASDNFNDIVTLVDNVRILKNQQEESLKQQQDQLKDFLEKERTKSNEILTEQKKILKELKQEKHKTYSKYFYVGCGCFCLGIALATIFCFSFANWINKDIIETQAQLKIERNNLEEQQAKNRVLESKYERFEKYNNLLVLFDKFNSKDRDAVSIYSGTNYLEKTLKDTTEEVLVLNIKPEFMSECSDNYKQKCYRDPKNKNYASYDGFYKASDGSYVISFKKNP